MSQRMSDLKAVLDIQMSQGKCIKEDPYMRGMTNGLLLAWYTMHEPYGTDVPFIGNFVEAQLKGEE